MIGTFAREHCDDIVNSLDQGFCLVEVLFDDAHVPFDCIVLEVNAGFERETGLQDIVGRRLSALVPAHERTWSRTCSDVVLTGVPRRFEHESAALHRWFDVYTFRVGDPELRRVAILLSDVTARKRTEAALQASEARQAYLLTLSDALRPLADAEAIKATATRTLGDHLGTDRAVYIEYVLKDGEGYWLIENVYHRPAYPFPDGLYPLNAFGRDAYEVLNGRRVVVNDVFTDPGIITAAKETFRASSVTAYVAIPLMKGGQFVALLAVQQGTPREWQPHELQLIEETAERTWAAAARARAERAQRRSEQRLRMALDVARMGTFLYHIAEDRGEPDSRLLALFGVPEGAPLSLKMALETLIHPDDRASYVDAIARSTDPAGDGLLRTEVRVVHPDGSLHWLEVTAQTFFEGEPRRPTVMLGMVVEITARKEAEEALRRAHDELERRVRERTAALETEVQERRTAEGQIKALFQRLISVQDDERRRIARDIHDQLGQHMTALRMHLHSLESLARDGPHGPALAEHAARTHRLAEELDGSIDFLTWELRPAALDHLGLAAALQKLVTGWSERFGIPAEFAAPERDGMRLPQEVESNLYRLVQEALHNVVKHAEATHVSLSLQRRDHQAVLVIEDNGRGFDVAVARGGGGGLGLISMQERTELSGGTLELESEPGHGTTIFVRVPIAATDVPTAE